jgi:hypothetical protein
MAVVTAQEAYKMGVDAGVKQLSGKVHSNLDKILGLSI